MSRSVTDDAPIGILCALPEEQALLVETLGHPPLLEGRALEARRGHLDGRAVVVAATGVGKVRAASAATLVIERLGCRALILSGVAGGLSERLSIGDIVIATRVIDLDYGRVNDAGRTVYRPGTLPVPEVEPDPGYQLAEETERRVREQLVRCGIETTLGTVLTGDAFVASAHVRDRLAADWDALAIEMEGSAICGVAERFDVPWLVVRALSDRAGEDSIVDFRAFVASAAASSARVVRELLPVFDESGHTGH
jgi:adenosylhomocysteine nucleosidase